MLNELFGLGIFSEKELIPFIANEAATLTLP
jgi:hypothetical protein